MSPFYMVEVTERVLKTYTVQADSEDDAESKALEGHTYAQQTGVPEKYDLHVSFIMKVDNDDDDI